MLKVWAVDEMVESDGASETGMDDEATGSSMSSSRNLFAGKKRYKQSTINLSNKPRKRVYCNVQENQSSSIQSCGNVVGNEVTIVSILYTNILNAVEHSTHFVLVSILTSICVQALTVNIFLL
jgi:hypothetical protein